MCRYPRAFFYALQLSLGVNEFGTARGFSIVSVPAMYYNDVSKCLKGGNTPDSSSTASLCAGPILWVCLSRCLHCCCGTVSAL
jgi:hypothetical protein